MHSRNVRVGDIAHTATATTTSPAAYLAVVVAAAAGITWPTSHAVFYGHNTADL